MLSGQFYSKLNAYYYARKSLDYLEYKEKKGILSEEDVKSRIESKKRAQKLENELFQACCEPQEF